MRDSTDTDFAALLRALDGPARLTPLVAALGFRPLRRGRPLSVPGSDARVIGERAGARVLLLGFDGRVDATRAGAVARTIRDRDLSTHNLFIAADSAWSRVFVACVGLEGELRHACIEPDAITAADAETLAEMASPPGEPGLAVALRHARALDRGRVTDRFFEDFRALRERVAAAWEGIPERSKTVRDELALLLLCRLMFLYFLQRAGRLGGDRAFLLRRFDEHRDAGRRGFYRLVLRPLFFGALNRRPELRTARARALGPLPYLNGGLFERVAAERKHPRLNLPDDATGAILDDLLERYRFAPRESGEDRIDGVSAVAVDPEMLGRVFERLMDPHRRGRTGTFYTPAGLVDAVVGDSLTALLADRVGIGSAEAASIVAGAPVDDPALRARVREAAAGLRVLDPACGSGAFLLGALSRLTRLAGDERTDRAEVRRRIVATGLHGVDLQGDAALLCSLRLWLALALEAPDPVPPLPNLDRRIRQGDALLDPLDLGHAAPDAAAARAAASDPAVRAALRALPSLAARYLDAEPPERPAIQRRLAAAEHTLARGWVAAHSARLARADAELRARVETRDLWGDPPPEAARAREALAVVRRARGELAALRRRIRRDRELPFFSFHVHFGEAAAGGFDLVLSNPPWVRAHAWPEPLRRLARHRFAVCRHAGWPAGSRLAGAPAAAGAQVDLSQLFIERSVQLLAPGGALGAVVPAKTLRSLYGGATRALLLRETRIHAIEDHGLDQRAIFRADSFAATVVATRVVTGVEDRESEVGHSPDPAPHTVRVRLSGRDRRPLRCEAPQDDLPLFPSDPRSPWLLAPGPARRALRRMQRAGPPLGRHPGLRVRRGVFTGANDVLLVTHAVPRLGDLVSIRAAGRESSGEAADVEAARTASFEAVIEAESLRPLLRGSGLSPWTFRTDGWVIWLHDDEGRPRPAPPRTARYLARHSRRLERRSGVRPGAGGSIFRAGPFTLAAKVAWQDLAPDLEAVVVPGLARNGLGGRAPIVPLNTIYFLPVDDQAAAWTLAAIFNSLPVRTFARAIAERAKDARFRFFAWTIACLPLPAHWCANPCADRIRRISEAAHADGAIPESARAELDQAVARLYGLTSHELDALAGFDAWLRGPSSMDTDGTGR